MITNLSHPQHTETFEAARQELVCKVEARGDLPYITVDKQLEMIEQASQFELGRFLIERVGLNGYWTHYIITYPEDQKREVHPFEKYLLDRAPTCLATQERFSIFKREIQKQIAEGCSFASVPSGLMGDLLDLNYNGLSDFRLTGIDLDPESLAQAAHYAGEKGLLNRSQFFQRDAWNLGFTEQFDLLTSNGLAIYEPNDQRVIELYREFHKALKPGGLLVTSFLTPLSAWKMDQIDQKDALLQKIFFGDILSAKWQVYRSEETVKKQLHEAGFVDIKIYYDRAHIFPTITGKKSKG